MIDLRCSDNAVYSADVTSWGTAVFSFPRHRDVEGWVLLNAGAILATGRVDLKVAPSETLSVGIYESHGRYTVRFGIAPTPMEVAAAVQGLRDIRDSL